MALNSLLCAGVPLRNCSFIHPDHQPFFISFIRLLQYTCCLTVFCTTSLQVVFGLLLGLEPSTSYSIHFFTQSLSSFCNTCPYHRNLFCCSTEIMSSIPSLCLNSLLGTLSFISYIHLTTLISAHWIATLFSFLTGQVHFRAAYYFAHNCCTVPSDNQWYIAIGKQWYQLPEFIPSKSYPDLRSCISISIHTLYVT